MKKVLAICLTVIMIVSMSVTAFAEPGKFLKSPSLNPIPEILEFLAKDDSCTAKLFITPYIDRDTLPDALRTLLEKAYADIVNSSDLTELNAAFAALAAENEIDGTKLAVSDLFDLHLTGCDYHEGHKDFDVVLKAETLKNFVALLHMNQNGEWELVTDAKVTNNGEHLEFSVESFSPFAIVVDTTNDNAGTSDNTMTYVYATLMAVSAAGLVVVLLLGRKKQKSSN